jgi:hypothetical protein
MLCDHAAGYLLRYLLEFWNAMFMKKIILISLSVFAVLLLAGCDDTPLEEYPGTGTETGNNEKIGKPKFSIGDATSLVVLDNSSNSGGRIAAESSNLYKITTSGSFEEVTFLNADNTPIDPTKTQTSVIVEKIFDVTKDYIILQGQFTAWDTLGNTQYYSTLLVHKGDGAIYDFNAMDIATEAISSDGHENFFYLNNSKMVMRVDGSNPELLRKSEYLPSGQTAEYFWVDRTGNLVYQYAEDKFRGRKKTGGIFELDIATELPGGPAPLPYGNYYNQGIWIGVNGKMYLETFDHGPSGYRPHYHTVSVDEQGTVAIDTVWTGAWKDDQGGSDYIVGSGSYNMRHVNKEKSILFVGWNRAWEFFEETNTLVEVHLPQVGFFDDFFYSESYLYYRSGLDIYKISLADYSYQLIHLPQDDQFEIYSMSIGINDTLQFSALRFSDGKNIIAQIDASGIFSVVDEVLDKEAIVLQRLN